MVNGAKVEQVHSRSSESMFCHFDGFSQSMQTALRIVERRWRWLCKRAKTVAIYRSALETKLKWVTMMSTDYECWRQMCRRRRCTNNILWANVRNVNPLAFLDISYKCREFPAGSEGNSLSPLFRCVEEAGWSWHWPMTRSVETFVRNGATLHIDVRALRHVESDRANLCPDPDGHSMSSVWCFGLLIECFHLFFAAS